MLIPAHPNPLSNRMKGSLTLTLALSNWRKGNIHPHPSSLPSREREIMEKVIRREREPIR
jgi:hypothetical protein